MQQCIEILISYLHEAQHVSGDTTPIIRSLKLHWQPLVLHTVDGCWTCSCWTLSASSNYTSNNSPRMQNQRLPVQF
jgi:hypothetical protein